MRNLLTVLAVALMLTCGCVVHGHHGHGRSVRVEPSHIHSVSCGHYHWRGHWYASHGHHHGSGCGHVFRNGIWIVVD